MVCIHVCLSSPKKKLVLEDEFLPKSFFTPKISHGECTFQGMFDIKGDGSILLIYTYIYIYIYIPSGKLSHNYGNHHVSWVNQQFCMAIFNSFLYVYQKVKHIDGFV